MKAPNSHVYLKLTVSGLPDSTATSLQVCDGETLWDYQVVLDSQNYRKLSIKPILERLNSPELNEKIKDQAHHFDGAGRTGDAACGATEDDQI